MIGSPTANPTGGSRSGLHDAGKSGVPLYFVLAYAVTWAFHLAIPALGFEFRLEPGSPGFVLYLLGILGPLVAALVVTAWKSGKAGVGRLLGAGIRWRFGLPWYGFAILAMPGFYLLLIGIFAASGGSVTGPLLVWSPGVLFLVLGQVWVVVGEEFGWRGFALPRLQMRYGSLGASLILGALWAGWHLPMFVVPGSFQHGTSFLQYLVAVTVQTILMTLLYNRSGGSVLACMIFHAMINVSAFVINFPPDLPGSFLLFYLLLVLAAVPFLPRPLFTHRRN